MNIDIIYNGFTPSKEILEEATKRVLERLQNRTKSENKFEKLLHSTDILFKKEVLFFISNEHYRILDFYQEETKTDFEVDGKTHIDKENKDILRDEQLLRFKVRTARFKYDGSKTTNFICYKHNIINEQTLKLKIFTNATKTSKPKQLKEKNFNEKQTKKETRRLKRVKNALEKGLNITPIETIKNSSFRPKPKTNKNKKKSLPYKSKKVLKKERKEAILIGGTIDRDQYGNKRSKLGQQLENRKRISEQENNILSEVVFEVPLST